MVEQDSLRIWLNVTVGQDWWTRLIDNMVGYDGWTRLLDQPYRETRGGGGKMWQAGQGNIEFLFNWKSSPRYSMTWMDVPSWSLGKDSNKPQSRIAWGTQRAQAYLYPPRRCHRNFRAVDRRSPPSSINAPSCSYFNARTCIARLALLHPSAPVVFVGRKG